MKCQTDENGNIILVDRDDTRLTEFVGGFAKSPVNLVDGFVSEEYDQLPIPEYLVEFDANAKRVEGTRQNVTGTLYFDNLTYVYGSTPEDTSAPEIDLHDKAGGADAVPLVLQHGAGFRRAGY